MKKIKLNLRPSILISILILIPISISCSSPTDFASQRKTMVEQQVLWRGVTDRRVLDAMLAVPREEFVLPKFRDKAYADLEVPIGFEQTLDRPYEDAFIVQALKIKPTDRVFEVGTGGGYLTALMSKLGGEVYTIDIIPEIADAARARFEKLGYKNIEVKAGDGYAGWVEHSPFDAIVFTCSPDEIPKPLIEQLGEGGRMVLPLGGEQKFQELLLYTKKNGKLEGPRHLAAFTFVPMKGQILEK
jgi:protein-L-isoaspartate(D-aspartate) O-methyltransferase